MTTRETVVVNHRGMVTIPKDIREKFNIREGTRVAFIEVDGAIEVIPIRSIEEMETACTIPLARMSAIMDEAREQELKLENDAP
ncbi:MAG: AbrB/MazE/SpoVT family DNA-binding domain-containing protein [Candidatus Lokiarchaeota archaeon]|nr:AbrB/MazE/SpoVT family DNA-binding domain-containing protein [Candidatus Lokiarchaeota archaeon]